jgi:hypothetical protein
VAVWSILLSGTVLKPPQAVDLRIKVSMAPTGCPWAKVRSKTLSTYLINPKDSRLIISLALRVLPKGAITVQLAETLKGTVRDATLTGLLMAREPPQD